VEEFMGLLPIKSVATSFVWCFLAVALASAGCRDSSTGPRELSRSTAIAMALAPEDETGEPMQVSAWSEPANLGPVVNSASNDQGPAISTDGLSLYFASTRTGGFGGNDIWVSSRANRNDPWGPPVNLGEVINTAAVESTPTLSRDGRFLYFASGRPGGVQGSIDIWVSERSDPRDDGSWQAPVNLGPAINSGAADLGPTFFVDPETARLTMYFYSTRPGGPGRRDIYRSTVDEQGNFVPAVLVSELSTPHEDEQPSIRRDGLEIFFASNRPGSLSSTATDIWVATRASTSDPWSQPVTLGQVINTDKLEARPFLSLDGRSLYFFSDGRGGSGGTDLFVSTRRRAGGGGE
jgi:Tol biopolymer transport system component